MGTPPPGDSSELRPALPDYTQTGVGCMVETHLGMARSTLRHRMTVHDLDSLIPDD